MAGEGQLRAVAAPGGPADRPGQGGDHEDPEAQEQGGEEPGAGEIPRRGLEHHEGRDEAEAQPDDLAVDDLRRHEFMTMSITPAERRELPPFSRRSTEERPELDDEPALRTDAAIHLSDKPACLDEYRTRPPAEWVTAHHHPGLPGHRR